MKRLFIKTVIASVALAAFGAASAQDIKERTIKFGLNGPEGHPAVPGMKKFAEAVAATAPSSAPNLPTDLVAHLDDVERDILARALERHRFNRTAAGASMGLSLRQMRYRMARLGVVVAGADTGD